MVGALPAQEIEVDGPPGLTLVGGEQLELALPGASVLRAAFFAYGLPLAGALALLALAWAVAGPLPDLAAVAIATGGLALGWCFSRQKLKSGDRHMEFAADIVCKHGTGR
jgi:positive regulator of sigma E activity